MKTIKEMIRQANADGYVDDNAEAKVCQDVVLKAISESTLSRNVAIKGGVVMRSISKDASLGMKENNMEAVVKRITRTFSSNRYINRLIDSKKNWIGEEISTITTRLIEFLKSLDL